MSEAISTAGRTFCSQQQHDWAAFPVSLQLNPTSAGDSAAYERRASSLDDVVIVSALRTPVCKAKRGGFKDTPADDLLAAVLKATLQQTGVEPQVPSVSMSSRAEKNPSVHIGNMSAWIGMLHANAPSCNSVSGIISPLSRS